MGDITIKTTQVLKAAMNITTCNSNIENAFEAVETAMKNLSDAWSGQASANAVSRFNSMKKGYKDTRYEVIRQYVDFLNQQIETGYEATETTNTSLADAFK